MLTAPTTAELAAFSGRPADSYGDFAAQALSQAALMFSVITKLPDYPADPDLAQLAKNAIMEMADRLTLEQPYQEISGSPFQTETIGSYSYSRVTATAIKVQNGVKAGLFWWDIAVDELQMAGVSRVASGSIKADIDDLRRGDDGLVHLVNPAHDADRPPYIRIS